MLQYISRWNRLLTNVQARGPKCQWSSWARGTMSSGRERQHRRSTSARLRNQREVTERGMQNPVTHTTTALPGTPSRNPMPPICRMFPHWASEV
ncbi:hypothetical protein EYF80_044153 [Liparis tanakae]|uniref:Uncharacterized protein n=1 Tax=Liparis tanakae TaxID=230148 RepID=A0A4Z2FWJ0_9TELE|nr:hypothetical protein EYF80_044153 [Liparis tanakae]